MISILFAAGQGSRLKPITDTIPKPLIKVAGKTLIEHNLEKIAPYSQAIVIVVNYLKDEIINHLGNNYQFEGRSIPILYAVQKSSKGGTMQAFRCGIEEAEKYFNETNTRSEEFENKSKNSQNSFNIGFLALNSDDIHGSIFLEIEQKIKQNPDLALITGIQIEDKDTLKNFGVLKTISEEGELFLEVIVEKPEFFVSDIINTGIYYFPNHISDIIKKIEPITEGQEEYITRDLIGKYILKNKMQVLIEDIWIPVNNHNELERAENFFAE